ncbi:MAG: hypothetical protein V5A43_00505 [Haloarculaceae archaeon]
MSKVSIALRGWRFDEDDVFDQDGDLKALGEMPADSRHRIVRLAQISGDACDACWLLHGEADIHRANQGTIVYGEPMAEVLLCADHEADFLYWFREAGGSASAGDAEFPDRFHEWFADGNRAPEDYEGLDHVEGEAGAYGFREASACGLDDVAHELDEMDRAEAEATDVDLDALDL